MRPTFDSAIVRCGARRRLGAVSAPVECLEEDSSMADQDITLMAHLMRRAGFSADRDELEELAAKEYEQVVEELLEPVKHGVPELDRDFLLRFYPNLEKPDPNRQAQSHYLYHMINSPRQLEEKMTLFWHTLFATGYAKVDNATELLRQIETFRKWGMGNYRDLMVELAKDPAMIYWLDNNYNHKDQPNENWGRELLELFSMGQGNYTEEDVFECARAFTGWTIGHKLPRGGVGRFLWSFKYAPEDHDDGEKSFMGHRGRFNGEDVIDVIVRQPATARFIARHLYNFFVADEVQVAAWLHTPPRDPVAVNILADAFISSGYEIKDTLRVLFNSDFFKDALYQRVRSPAEVVVSVCRQVGDFRFPKPGLQVISDETGFQGQALLDPPSVEGWHYGAEWIDSGSLVRRINYAADLFGNLEMPGVESIVDRVRASGVTSPIELVDTCLDLIGPLEVTDQTREELIALSERSGELRWHGEVETSESVRRVGDMLALIASTREFQFC